MRWQVCITGNRSMPIVQGVGVDLQVAHVTGEVQFPKTKEGKVDMGWAAGQVATTADFSHNSWFWTHFSGGLNYQVC